MTSNPITASKPPVMTDPQRSEQPIPRVALDQDISGDMTAIQWEDRQQV